MRCDTRVASTAEQQIHAPPRNTHLEDADNLDVLGLALSLQEGQHLPDLVRRLRDAVDRAVDVAVHAERERVDRVALEGHLVGRFAGRERPSFRFRGGGYIQLRHVFLASRNVQNAAADQRGDSFCAVCLG